jgi:RNA polymerase sigma-70 factor (ECF subfamily)
MTGPIPRQLDRRRLGDHLDRLYRAAWGLCGSREEAEDLVQETFARVLAKPRFLRSDDDLGYLLRVLRNTFYSDRRTAARRPVTAPMPDEGAPLADTVSPSPHEALEARAVYAAIAALPPDFRDVVVAVDVTGLSYDEAARALRVPPGTVMSRLYRARRRIADALE